jgi:hypothetical protein
LSMSTLYHWVTANSLNLKISSPTTLETTDGSQRTSGSNGSANAGWHGS